MRCLAGLIGAMAWFTLQYIGAALPPNPAFGGLSEDQRSKPAMNEVDRSDIEREVWATVQALNRAWTVEGNPAALRSYFHKDVVVIDPVHPKRIEGGEAAVAAWTEFVKAAKIRYWREFDPKVQVHGDGRFAIVTYYYDASYEMGGRTIKTGGRDMFALVKDNGRWWVVADQFSQYPKAEAR